MMIMVMIKQTTPYNIQ